MRLVTIKADNEEIGGIVTTKGVVTLPVLNRVTGSRWPETVGQLLADGGFDRLLLYYNGGGKEVLEAIDQAIPADQVSFGPLYRHPQKIFGIGLNYRDHASDLAERAPEEEPASFFKPATTIIGDGDAIAIPLQSEKTTGEAELGIVFKKECENVEREDWLDYVAGFTTVIDMTAEDILRKNPRYLTRAKSFETFFSFGPQLVSPDEVEDVLRLKVATVINGAVHAENLVANMIFPPDYLVSFHSKVMKFLPGDILSTGTPRAVALSEGDVAECRIDGFLPLRNPVIDKKRK